MRQVACYGVSGLCLLGAGAYLLLGPDKGLGILLAILAVIVTRVLVLNIAGRFR